jgi:separase
LAAAPTLRRELLDSIYRKISNKNVDGLEWRVMSATGSPLRPPQSKPHRGALLFTGSDDDDESNEEDGSMTTYWREVQDRYRSECCDPVSLATSQADLLPLNWTVISVTVTEDRNTMIISRQRPHRTPLVFYLPMNRQERREDDGEDNFTYDAAIEELESIIDASNATARNAIDVSGKADRKAWWAERTSLDNRLRTLLENVEFCWLGVFKVRELADFHA